MEKKPINDYDDNFDEYFCNSTTKEQKLTDLTKFSEKNALSYNIYSLNEEQRIIYRQQFRKKEEERNNIKFNNYIFNGDSLKQSEYLDEYKKNDNEMKNKIATNPNANPLINECDDF